MTKKRPPPKRRNVMAKALSQKQFRQKIVPNKKRKAKDNPDEIR